MANTMTNKLRNESIVELEAKAKGYRFTLRLLTPKPHPASGVESPPRKVQVELLVGIGDAFNTISERLIRPTDKVCGEFLTISWGIPSTNCRSRVTFFEAFTLSEAVDAAVACAREIDAAAYTHQVARAAAIAAENAAYKIRLES